MLCLHFWSLIAQHNCSTFLQKTLKSLLQQLCRLMDSLMSCFCGCSVSPQLLTTVSTFCLASCDSPPFHPGSYSALLSVFPFHYFSILSTLASRFSSDQRRSVSLLFLLIRSSRAERRTVLR